MGQRLALHEILVGLCAHVYFQPPSNVSLIYPCILYELSDVETIYADDRTYRVTDRWNITAIFRDPDDPLPDQIRKLPMTRFDRAYRADNLNHQTFNMYF